jgi:hypothetical protein
MDVHIYYKDYKYNFNMLVGIINGLKKVYQRLLQNYKILQN